MSGTQPKGPAVGQRPLDGSGAMDRIAGKNRCVFKALGARATAVDGATFRAPGGNRKKPRMAVYWIPLYRCWDRYGERPRWLRPEGLAALRTRHRYMMYQRRGMAKGSGLPRRCASRYDMHAR